MQKYYNKSKVYSGVSSFWMFKKNKPIIDTLNKPSNQKANIPHDKLIKTPNSVIDFALKGTTKNKIFINNDGISHWCKSSKYFVFRNNSLKKAAEYLIRDCYFATGDQVFQQIIRTPMGSDVNSFFILLRKKMLYQPESFVLTFTLKDYLITISNYHI